MSAKKLCVPIDIMSSILNDFFPFEIEKTVNGGASQEVAGASIFFGRLPVLPKKSGGCRCMLNYFLANTPEKWRCIDFLAKKMKKKRRENLKKTWSNGVYATGNQWEYKWWFSPLT